MGKRVERWRAVAALVGFGLMIGPGLTFTQTAPGQVTVIHESRRAVSLPLDHTPPVPPAGGTQRVIPLLPTHATGNRRVQPDPALQQPGTASPLTATVGIGFAGIGVGLGGYSPQYIPPDTNGAAGATQYVQWVNADFAVFNKSTGAVEYGPAAGNTLWSGLGGACAANNSGDPIAQYDKQAGRWVMMQPVFSKPYYLCIAVSQTSDATGQFNLYQFAVPNNTKNFPDYPKLAVWPDGYYISFNSFNGNRFLGPTACVADRSAMLAGGAATMQCTNALGPSYSTLLPGDLDGDLPGVSGTTVAPPAGSPDYYLNFGTNSLSVWKFHVNWSNAANSTFAGPITVSGVDAFTEACGGGACIPQTGTNNTLDSLGDRLMYRLAYRNFGDHESLVASQSVDTGSGNTGVRWYEIRSPGSSPSVYQQGSYSPDFTNYRWMPSIAMDKGGDIALGYSESSGSRNPAIYFTGHVPGTDALGAMEAETSIINGTGSQTQYNRWGDYSSMSVDPTDDCTFWYTNEYLQATGVFNWGTQIASFAFPGCSGITSSPDFSISGTPSSQTVTAGSGTSYGVTVAASGGYTGTVNLSASGLPTGASANFGPSSLTGGSGSSTMSVSTGSSTPAGNYTITITGTDSGGTPSHSTVVTLVVNALSSADFSISATPGNVTLKGGGTATYTVNVTPSGGFNGTVSFILSGYPGGSTYAFSPATVTGSGSTTLSVTAPGGSSSNNTLTITGSAGALSHSASVGLKIR